MLERTLVLFFELRIFKLKNRSYKWLERLEHLVAIIRLVTEDNRVTQGVSKAVEDGRRHTRTTHFP